MNQDFLNFMNAQILVEKKLIKLGIQKEKAVILSGEISQIFLDQNVVKEDVINGIKTFIK